MAGILWQEFHGLRAPRHLGSLERSADCQHRPAKRLPAAFRHGAILIERPPKRFETPRLRLHAGCAAHATALHAAYTGRADASRFLQRSPHPSESHTAAVLDRWGEASWPTTTRFVWTILLRPADEPIGLFLMFVDGDRAEIHYGIGSAHWGRGLVPEAGRTVMEWVEQRSALAEVSTTCAAEHEASLAVLEKIGLGRVRLLPAALPLAATGTRVDAWLYAWRRN